MNTTRNGSTAQILARSLTNGALAARIDMMLDSRRSFDKETSDAYLEEVSRRLRWKDAYDNHLETS